MFWFSFARWSTSSGSYFIAERVYKDGYKWTPIVYLRPRYTFSTISNNNVEDKDIRKVPKRPILSRKKDK